MRVALYTLGCKVNQFESAALAEAFSRHDSRIVSFSEQADLYIVNTCAVTTKAAYQSRQVLRRAMRNNPSARILATGCYVQIGAQEILEGIPGPICLVGNDQKGALVDLALTSDDCLEYYVGDISARHTIEPFHIQWPAERTRAFVRVQDGCNAHCAYCIVPYSRGPSRSLAPALVRRQIDVLAENGIKEIVLTGIHIGAYGLDLVPETTLLSLLKDLTISHPLVRFRLSSIEPTELTLAMIHWARKTPNFCPHWHVPLQSGSDRILSLMNRRYRVRAYADLIWSIRNFMPSAAIGADVLVGFPSEDEQAFQNTLELLQDLPVTYVHAFPFSSRPGTLAEAFPNRVTRAEKRRRVKTLRALGSAKQEVFYRSQLGKVLPCLIEQQDRQTGLWRGLSANYVRVLVEDAAPHFDLRNRCLDVRIQRVTDGAVYGRLVH